MAKKKNAKDKKNYGYSVASLVLGICSVLFFWTIVVPLLAIIFGAIALNHKPKDKKTKNYAYIGLGMGCFFLIIGFIFLFSNSSKDDTSSTTNENSSDIITTNVTSLLPQDSEIDREWVFEEIQPPKKNFTGPIDITEEIDEPDPDPIQPISVNSTGFIEGAERGISKVQGFSGTSIRLKAYRFDSIENATKFYEQEKEKIDIRGYEEWNLGSGCFGIDISAGLGGKGNAKGLCLRKNIVFYVRSAYNSLSYTSDGKSEGKEFMEDMLKKV